MRIAAKATKGKGKTWRKGQSSSSNPSNRRFRSQSKLCSPFNTITPEVGDGSTSSTNSQSAGDRKSQLTVEALASHNAFQLENLRLDKGEEEEDGAETVVSFASVWSNCSNASFGRFLANWQSSSSLHKEMLAVLGTAAETIKSRGGTETETEYFAVLMTTLENVATDESLTATIALLQMVLKRLSPAIMKLKFSETSRVFVEYLGKYMGSENGTLLRGLISCLSLLLRAQEEAIWCLSQTQQVFDAVIAFATHAKPRVRKSAQKAVLGVLKGSAIMNKQDAPEFHPAAGAVAKHCVREIEETGLGDLDVSKVLHIIGLMKSVLNVLPRSSLQKCCETMLRFMTFNNVLIRTSCFQGFHSLFSSKTPAKGLTADMNSQIISALFDFQPSINDSQPLSAWLAVFPEALVSLYSLDTSLFSKQLVKMFEVSSACWLSDSKQVHEVVADGLKHVIKNTIKPSIEGDNQCLSLETLMRVFCSIEGCLSYQYNTSWDSVLGVISFSFETLGPHYPNAAKTVKTLADLRESFQFKYTAELDGVVGSAVKLIGPEFVVKSIPLEIDNEKNDFSRSWLVPVLRDNIEKAKLGFFARYFLPFALEVEQKSQQLAKAGKAVESKAYSILYIQIWSLLPAFCNNPTDLKDSLKLMAKTMGTALTDSDIKHYILASIRILIATSADDKESREELAKYGKNFLPILFNLYTDRTEDKRLEVFETIQRYLTVADKSLLEALLARCLQRYQSEASSDALTESFLDIIRCFVPYVTDDSIVDKLLDSVAVPLISDKDRTKQKKGYRLIEEICKSPTETCQSVVDNRLPEVIKILVASLRTCPTSAKSAPIKALRALADRYYSDIEDKDAFEKIVHQILPQVVDCVPLNSNRTRTAAFELLVTIARTYSTFDENGLETFLLNVMKSLDETSMYTKTGIVLTLAHLMTEFKDSISGKLKQDIVVKVINLLKSGNRQVIQAVIDFIKLLFKGATQDEVLPFVDVLVSNITSLGSDNQKHFRVKVKEILVRLVRKFGGELITKLVPENFHKVLRNVRKIESRKARKRDEKDSDSDYETIRPKKTESIQEILRDSSDEEMDGEEEDGPRERFGRKEARAWIEENVEEEDVLDLLSKKANRNILSSNPFKKKVDPRKEPQEFKVTEDGRIIIEASEESKASKRKRDEAEDNGEEGEGEEPVEEETAPKYRHGGQGIHRVPVKRRKAKETPSDLKSGKEYKAKKAGGDMKRKGQPDPFAYLPLNRQLLNKRKKAKLSGQFKSIVRAAKRGADSGAKNKKHRK